MESTRILPYKFYKQTILNNISISQILIIYKKERLISIENRQNEENVSISTNCTKNYFKKLNESYKLIFTNFETTNNLGFYRFFYARIMPYLLCKIVDTNALEDDNEISEVLKMLKWFFKQKDIYNVVVINDKLNEIVKNINNENYKEAVNKIKETKKYRNSINDVEREEMYAPSRELYQKMSEKN